MSGLFDLIFGLDGVGFGSDGVSLEFARPLPGWAWALIVPIGTALAAVGYARVAMSVPRRILLASVRATLLIVLVVLIAGPQLVRPNERVEPDRVIVLADRSASMLIGDGGSRGSREPRDEQLRRAVVALLAELGPDSEERTVEIIGFDDRSYALGSPDSAESATIGDEAAQRASIAWGEPDGQRTLLGRAVDRAVSRSAGKPIAGFVILSDGRSADAVSPTTLRDLQASGTPVFTVPLGEQESIGDVRIVRAEAPSLAFEQDRVPVTVELGGATPGTVLELIDEKTGRTLATERLNQNSPGLLGEAVTLTIDPPGLGARSIVVRATAAGEDLVAANNESRLTVRFVDRPVRVLYLDGYPRWEYRYLKNLLVREPSINASAMLVSNRHEYLQEGDIALTTLPESPEEWAPFDVVILGDLRPELLGERRLAQLRDHVAERGAGLIWIAGDGATPSSWGDSVLAGLLPIRVGPDGVGVRSAAVTASRTDLAARQGLFALDADGGWPARLADPTTGWSLLRRTTNIQPEMLKPTAQVLIDAIAEDSGLTSPLVVAVRFGAGRSVLVGTDETWRYRYARGETLTERFWIPLIRSLGREALAGRGAGGVLTVTPERPSVSTPVRVELIVNDQGVLDRRPASIELTATDESGRRTTYALTPESPGSPRFAMTWTPDRAGLVQLDVTDVLLAPAPGEDGLEAAVEVVSPQDEFLRAGADHEALRNLSAATGGETVPPTGAGSIAAKLPNRSRRVAIAPDIATLWDRPVTLLVVFSLLIGEWLARRRWRLI